MTNKQLIRAQIKAKLKNIDDNFRYKTALNIINIITNNLDINNYHNIACYWPFHYEIDTRDLIKFLLANNKNCYLPVINNNLNLLDFIKYTNNTKLTANKFNILEPKFNKNNKININNLDLIFLPLIAFDKSGNRIGSGGGYYDRTLVNYNYQNIKLIGLGYDIQQTENIEHNSWDIKLNNIATESRWIECIS